MYSDRSLIPTEAVRLAALGSLALGPKRGGGGLAQGISQGLQRQQQSDLQMAQMKRGEAVQQQAMQRQAMQQEAQSHKPR